MDNNPIIVTVMCFVKHDTGLYKLDVHYVAGFDSADAQNRIVNFANSYLNGHRFIQTDEYLEYYDRNSVRLFATRLTDEDSITEEQFAKWVTRSIHGSNEDGEDYPAAYRRF